MKTRLKIAFDIGGVLSKYTDVFRPLFTALLGCPGIDVHVISDMKPRQKAIDFCKENGFWPGDWDNAEDRRVHCADYETHGERCKAALCEELGIDILIDDHMGYLCCPGLPRVRLLVMPDPTLPYYHDDWVTDGSEGDFGRRRNQRQNGE